MTTHQQKQIEAINSIENQIKNKLLSFSTVTPVPDFAADPRICLTSVHLPDKKIVKKIYSEIINPLKETDPSLYFYLPDSLHITIKNIRVIDNPPTFNEKAIEKAEEVFSKIITMHKKFNVYYYRLLLFPNNLALIGTTDEELDKLIFDLDTGLSEVNLTDDKKYVNKKFFFSNITLCRFESYSDEFGKKVEQISENLKFQPYAVHNVSLVTTNAAFTKTKIINTWQLR